MAIRLIRLLRFIEVLIYHLNFYDNLDSGECIVHGYVESFRSAIELRSREALKGQWSSIDFQLAMSCHVKYKNRKWSLSINKSLQIYSTTRLWLLLLLMLVFDGGGSCSQRVSGFLPIYNNCRQTTINSKDILFAQQKVAACNCFFCVILLLQHIKHWTSAHHHHHHYG